MIYIGSAEQVQAYRDSDALNQSSAKNLDKGLEYFLAELKRHEDSKDSPEKEHFLIGGAVDCKLTAEKQEFIDTYHFSQVAKPTESVLNIINRLVARLVENNAVAPLDTLDEEILVICDEESYQTRWKPETRVNKIKSEGEHYFIDCVVSIGKKILSNEQGSKVDTIVNSLRNNPRTRDYFDREFFANNPHIDIYYQLPIFFTYDGVKCKALLDILIVEKDPNTGKVIAVYPIDLKTMAGYTLTFPESVKKRRYDIQGAWYTAALAAIVKTSPMNLPEFDSSVIKPFQFIVESTTSPGRPLVYTLTEEYLQVGEFGFIDGYTGKMKVNGFKKLISDYKYHEETGWVEDQIVSATNGRLMLGYNGIEI